MSGRLNGGTLMKQVAAQADIIRATTARVIATRTLHEWAGAWRSAGKPPLVLTGMGASLFAAEAAAVELQRAAAPARAIPTSDLLDYELDSLSDQTWVVAVSQSGESIEIAALIDRIPSDRLFAITNGPGSRLANKCPRTMLLGVTTQETVAISTYTASLAVLLMFGSELLGDPGETAAGLRAATDEMDSRLTYWDAEAARLAEQLADVTLLSFLGWGRGIASAREAALLLKEGARRPAEAMGAAMFRHGAVELVDERHAAVFFMNDQGDAAREDAWGYVNQLVALSGRVVTIGPELPPDLAGRGVTAIRAGEGTAASTLVEMVPVQVLAAHLAQQAGFVAGSFRNTTPVISALPARGAQ